MKKITFVFLFFIFIFVDLSADTAGNIYIFSFEPEGLATEDDAVTIWNALVAKLDSSGYLKVVSMDKTKIVMDKLGISSFDPDDKNLIKKAAELCKPAVFASGSVYRDSTVNTISLQLKFFDPAHLNDSYSFMSSRKFSVFDPAAIAEYLSKTVAVQILDSKVVYQFKPGKMDKDEVLALLKKYDPDGWYVVDLMDKGILLKRNADFMAWVASPETPANDLLVAVHEECHAYQLSYSKKSNTFSCYFDPKKTIEIQKSDVFPSIDIAKDISEVLRTNRFNVYINSNNPFQSTQQFGIFGLMGELDAYYQGTKTAILLYPYYKEKFLDDPKEMISYLGTINGDMYAYQEFRFFILRYLLYAQKIKPKIYKTLLGNKKLIEAFNMLDKAYASLFEKRMEIFLDIEKEYVKNGFYVQKTDRFFNIGKTENKISGTSLKLEISLLLDEEMRKPEYKKIEKDFFGIK